MNAKRRDVLRSDGARFAGPKPLNDDELIAVSGGVKLLDKSSAKLHEAASNGAHLAEVTVHLF